MSLRRLFEAMVDATLILLSFAAGIATVLLLLYAGFYVVDHVGMVAATLLSCLTVLWLTLVVAFYYDY